MGGTENVTIPSSETTTGDAALTTSQEKKSDRISASANRMRLHRRRRKEGRRILRVELWEAEVDFLIARGLLQANDRGVSAQVVNALHRYFDQGVLGRRVAPTPSKQTTVTGPH
jgi:hypothetical protein